MLQVIGTEDETWGSELRQKYRQRLPNPRRLTEGADHENALTRADGCHEAFADMLRAQR